MTPNNISCTQLSITNRRLVSSICSQSHDASLHAPPSSSFSSHSLTGVLSSSEINSHYSNESSASSTDSRPLHHHRNRLKHQTSNISSSKLCSSTDHLLPSLNCSRWLSQSLFVSSLFTGPTMIHHSSTPSPPPSAASSSHVCSSVIPRSSHRSCSSSKAKTDSLSGGCCCILSRRPNSKSASSALFPASSISFNSASLLLGMCCCLLLTQFVSVCESVRVVSLNVPSRVRKGSDLELSCLFDLGNATLYSLKWFYRAHEWDRDEQEFFRYTPRLKPYKQVFPLEGIQVDINRSGGGTVYIQEANGKTSGKYKCEISIEGTFQTVAAEKLMTVFNAANGNGIPRFKANQLLTISLLICGLFFMKIIF